MWKRIEEYWVDRVQLAHSIPNEMRTKLSSEIGRFISGHYMTVMGAALLTSAILEHRSPISSGGWTVLGLTNSLLCWEKRLWSVEYVGLLFGWMLLSWAFVFSVRPSLDFGVFLLRITPIALCLIVWFSLSHTYLMRREVWRALDEIEWKDLIIADRLTHVEALQLLSQLKDSGGMITDLEVNHRGGPGYEIRGFVSSSFVPVSEVFEICVEVIEYELELFKPEDVRFCISYKESQPEHPPA